MFTKLISPIKGIFPKIVTGFKRFPEAIILATTAVLIQIVLNHGHFEAENLKTTQDTLKRLAMIASLGIPLFLSIKIFFECFSLRDRSAKLSIYFGAMIGLVLYYFFLLKDFTMVPVTRYIAFTMVCYLLFLFVPFVLKRENFELYCVRLLMDFSTTFFYTAVLYLGLSAMLFTISKLFLIDIGMLYFDVWLVAAGIFAPSFFLAKVPEIKDGFRAEGFPKVLKFLILYIVIPMIVVYSLILYAYCVKIIITRVWPFGIVSHLILWYALISCLVLFLINPLQHAVKWIPKFHSLFPKIMLPLLAMLFVSVGIRIHAYGVTENRYFVIAAALWATGCMLYFAFSKKIANIILPISLAAITLLSVSGPWSSYSISKFSQNNHFTAILKKHEMIRGNTVVKPNSPLSQNEQAEVSAILTYFENSHSLRDLKYLPDDFKLSQTSKTFGFTMNSDDTNIVDSFFHYDSLHIPPVNIHDYEYYVDVGNFDLDKSVSGTMIKVTYSTATNILKIALQDRVIYQKNLTSLINDQVLNSKTPSLEKPLTFRDENSHIKILYAFNDVSGRKGLITDEVKFNNMNFAIFFKLK